MDNENNKPDLNNLVNSYRETKAPPGFAQRVSAHVEVDVDKSPSTGFPRFAVAASIGIVAIISLILVLPLSNTNLKDSQTTQIAQQASTTEEDQGIKDPALTASIDPEPNLEKAETALSIAITEKELQKFFSSEAEADESSLAVLTDISDWLLTQGDTDIPDISDMPDISDIDALFETT